MTRLCFLARCRDQVLVHQRALDCITQASGKTMSEVCFFARNGWFTQLGQIVMTGSVGEGANVRIP